MDPKISRDPYAILNVGIYFTVKDNADVLPYYRTYQKSIYDTSGILRVKFNLIYY